MLEFYPFPEREEKSEMFSVLVDGKKVDCYGAVVSACPFNQVWPGYQRPIEQTENTAFVMFGADGEFEMSVETEGEFDEVIVRPLSKNVKVRKVGNAYKFLLPGVGQYTCEFGDLHTTLHIFVNPIKDFDVDREDENVVYFDRGVYYMDEPLELFDNQTVYLDKGAVVYGAFKAKNASNIRILGYGILDNSTFEKGKGSSVNATRCCNVLIDGITVRDSSGWTMHLAGCDNCLVDNVKFIGMWRYNSDGCDMTNSTNCVLRNSFLRDYDDCVVVKGLKGNDDKDVRNIYVENCVTWCDWGRNLELGAETCADTFSNVHFKNCDMIHVTHIALDLQHGDRAHISNVTFEDMRIEYSKYNAKPYLQTFKGEKYVEKDGDLPSLACVNTIRTMYSKDDTTGDIDGVLFKDIKVTSDGRVPSISVGPITAGTVKNVVFDNYTVNGRKIENAADAKIDVPNKTPVEDIVRFVR